MKRIILTITSILFLAARPITAMAIEENIVSKDYINSIDKVEIGTNKGVSLIFESVHMEKDINIGCDITDVESDTFGKLSCIEFDIYDYSPDLITVRIPYKAKDGTKIYILTGESDYTYNTFFVSEVVDNYFEFDVHELSKYTFSETDVVSIKEAIGELKMRAIEVDSNEILPVSENVKKVSTFAFFSVFLFFFAALTILIRFVVNRLLRNKH